MDRRAQAANNLAARLLAGPWTDQAIASGIEAVLGPVAPRARAKLAISLADLGERGYPPAPHRLAAFLLASESFRPKVGRPIATVLAPPRFAPSEAFAGLPIPALATLGDLGNWLGVRPGTLDSMAGELGGNGRVRDSRLQHYRYSFIGKRNGVPRLLEAPKQRLKHVQRRILDGILSVVPVHDSARGFVPGRSCLTHAQVHAAEAVVFTLDLVEFFPTIGLPRIHGLFRRLGYPWAVARRLAGLCTTTTPADVYLALPAHKRPGYAVSARYRTAHLPQGAPTSPALSNLVAWKLDLRLHKLAQAAGANYTRYADDLAFSGDERFARGLDRFTAAIDRVVREEGFAVNDTKTRTMLRSARQSVTGIVVNEHCNVGRAQLDELKATLHNCTRTGPAMQNRGDLPDYKRHLDGRITWVEQINPARGLKLRVIFDQIDWRRS